ncbi:helix-turn-helix transcriptional regulator [Nannocystis pusilla]|uniref:helix-turn-helix transcriptional regulator n=1 Tax=Nannocystis pusilla TaxID=889268 RepID=UPI003DA4AA77
MVPRSPVMGIGRRWLSLFHMPRLKHYTRPGPAPAATNPPQLMTAAQLAALLSTAQKQVYEWTAKQWIPAHCVVRVGGRLLRYDASAIARWLEGARAGADPVIAT